VAQHLGETPPRPSELRVSLVPWDEPLLRAMAKDPAARFASLEEMRQAIANIPVEMELTPSLAPIPVEAPPPKQKAERYVIGGELLRTNYSILVHAEDTQLGRQVVIEDFQLLAPEHLKWLKAMARNGGPHLQRVLRIIVDEGENRVIYEAIAGAPGAIDESAKRQILAALKPIHDAGFAHGSLKESILFDENGPIVLVAGRAPTDKPDEL
jgi:hypothetical protein